VQAQSRELTVLFSDVRGFTTISEGLPATELADLINGFLTPMTQIIHQHRGTIDKYMGDAIMAFWGAPIPDPDHAIRAVDTALEMVDALKVLNVRFAARHWPELRIGVGVNTGPMNVGNMGSEFRMAYTVMGDAVNLGSRLEGLTKTYHVSIIVSDSTRQAAPEFTYRVLDRVRVKGKVLPVTIHEPLGRTEAVGMAWEEELAMHQQAMELYWEQEWAEAEERFKGLLLSSRRPDLYTLYLERIDHYRDVPPGPDWDGSFTHTSK
jgi:adenylate cyclase